MHEILNVLAVLDANVLIMLSSFATHNYSYQL